MSHKIIEINSETGEMEKEIGVDSISFEVYSFLESGGHTCEYWNNVSDLEKYVKSIEKVYSKWVDDAGNNVYAPWDQNLFDNCICDTDETCECEEKYPNCCCDECDGDRALITIIDRKMLIHF